MTGKKIKPGRLFVLSAPSGAGKSTLENRILEKIPELVYSVSYTTRAPRPGERNGHNYNFITIDEFKAMIEQNDFLEWAEVFGHLYGTGRQWVADRLKAGHDVLADLDVQGATAVKEALPEAILIFMVPPNIQELWRRLRERQTESGAETKLRLGRASDEISRRFIYDFLLINDDLNRVSEDFVQIIKTGHGLPMAEMEEFWLKFFEGSQTLNQI